MAIAAVQDISGGAENSNSFSLAFGSNCTAGNFLSRQDSIWDSPNPSATAPTGGGTWSTTTAPTAGATNAFQSYCANATGGATTVTVDYGTGFYIRSTISEFSGITTTSPLDVQTSNSGTSSTPSSGTTGTTAQADELVLITLAVDTGPIVGGLGIDAASGYTNMDVWQQDTADTFDYAGTSHDYKIVAATGTQSGSWGTLVGSYAWRGKIATFKAAAGGGGGTTRGTPFGHRGTAFNGGRTFNGIVQ